MIKSRILTNILKLQDILRNIINSSKHTVTLTRGFTYLELGLSGDLTRTGLSSSVTIVALTRGLPWSLHILGSSWDWLSIISNYSYINFEAEPKPEIFLGVAKYPGRCKGAIAF